MPILPPMPETWINPPSLKDAAEIQREMAQLLRPSAQPLPVRLVAGVDVSQQPRDPLRRIYAAVVLLDAQTMTVLETATAMQVAPFPYVPGFLAFREVPALLAAFAKLSLWPDVILVDGHGTAHPRGLGIAAHLGVVLDRPTLGCGKTLLIGALGAELAAQKGARAPVVWKGKTVATALRTRPCAAPIYVSAGQHMDNDMATDFALRFTGKWRLPLPTRAAHLAANAFRRRCLVEG